MANGSERLAPELGILPSLTPVATPVNTFVDDNSLGQLANSLRDLNPTLNNFLQQANEKDYAAGEAAFTKAKVNLKDAVDKGLLPAGASPAFKRGYEETALRVSGMNYDQALKQAYSKSDAANSDDPNVYQNFVQDFTAKYAQDNLSGYDTLDVAKSFTPLAERAQMSLSDFHIQQRAQATEDAWMSASQDEVSHIIDAAHANNFSAEQTGQAIASAMQKQLSNGYHDRSTYNKTIVSLIASKAEAAGDPTILEALNHIPAGPGGTLGKTAYAQAQIVESDARILNVQRDNQRWDWAQQDRAFTLQEHQWAQQEHAHTMQDWNIEKTAGTLSRNLISQIILNPTADYSKDIAQLALMDRTGSAARTVQDFKQSVLNGATQGHDDPHTVTALYNDMLTNPGNFSPTKIVSAYNSGELSMHTMQTMLDDARSASQNGGSPFTQDAVYKTLKDGVTKAFNGDPMTFDVDKADKATNAIVSFERYTNEWLSTHQNASRDEFLNAMQAYKDKLVKPLLEDNAVTTSATKPATKQAQPKPSWAK